MLTIVFFSLTSTSSCCYRYFPFLFLLNFLFYLRRPLITVFHLFLLHICSLCSFFIWLTYSDLSHYDTDDGTRTLDPHWWRVNKPSLGVPEALLDYRPKDGWLKGILIKRKSRGKTAWWQTEKINLFLESSCFSYWHRSLLLPSPYVCHFNIITPHESLVYENSS